MDSNQFTLSGKLKIDLVISRSVPKQTSKLLKLATVRLEIST